MIWETLAEAKKGDADAQIKLGLYCWSATNYTEAAEWFRKAAEQGNAKGEILLANCYQLGLGVPTDEAKSSEWIGRAFDNPQSFELFRQGAEEGLAAAQFYLGRCYALGQGVVPNHPEAANWYRKAAEQGIAAAQTALGSCFYQGLGVSRDYSRAVELFQKASEQGDARGQGLLGICYADGLGVPKNDIEAYKWLSLAAAHLSENSAREEIGKALNSVGARMSRAEIVVAQQRSAEFVPRKEAQGASAGRDIFNIVGANMDRPKATGTGFFITEDGALVTNQHLVKDASQIRLITRNGSISAKVTRTDAANDLALLRAEGKFAALTISASRAVKLGDTVTTIGFPNIALQGFAPKLAKGEIASLSGAQDDPRYFQISVPVQPGNSGGALVDERGNVVGVVSAKLNSATALAATGALPENVNYAIKSSFLLSFLESVPEVSAKLKEPDGKEQKIEDVVRSAEQAAVLVLVY